MVYPLGSGMERAQVLSKLREPDITFPVDFWSDKRATQGAIIKALLNHSPVERPSSSELLNSGKLPFMIEDKTISHALQSLSDPNAPYHSQVMQALFAQNTKEYKDHTYDTEKKGVTAQDLMLQSLVKERLTDVFRNHGAVETSRSLLLPRSKLYSREVVRLMDPHGTLVQLPYDLTLPHARFLADRRPRHQRRLLLAPYTGRTLEADNRGPMGKLTLILSHTAPPPPMVLHWRRRRLSRWWMK